MANITAVYPGSFDPPTNGHLDLIKRASLLFPQVIVAVADNPNKTPSFPLKKRIEVLKKITKNIKTVQVEGFSGLLVNYLKKRKARVILRGLRAVSDFEHEFQLALMNRKLFGDIETIFLMPDEKYVYLSSSIVKEVAQLGGDVGCLVPNEVNKMLVKNRKRKHANIQTH